MPRTRTSANQLHRADTNKGGLGCSMVQMPPSKKVLSTDQYWQSSAQAAVLAKHTSSGLKSEC